MLLWCSTDGSLDFMVWFLSLYAVCIFTICSQMCKMGFWRLRSDWISLCWKKFAHPWLWSLKSPILFWEIWLQWGAYCSSASSAYSLPETSLTGENFFLTSGGLTFHLFNNVTVTDYCSCNNKHEENVLRPCCRSKQRRPHTVCLYVVCTTELTEF